MRARKPQPEPSADQLLARAGRLFAGQDLATVLGVLEAVYLHAAGQGTPAVRAVAIQRLQLLVAELEAIDAQRH